MTIYNLTDDSKQRELNNKEPKVHRSTDELSEQELKELMGINRDKYHRVNGRVKRK